MENETIRKKAGRALCALLMVVMLSTLLFSAFFLAAESNHSHVHAHEEEHCSICFMIKVCRTYLRRLVRSMSLSVPVLFTLLVAGLAHREGRLVFVPSSLQSWKVRLDN